MSAAQLLVASIALAAALIYLPYVAVVLGRFQVGYDYSAPRALFDRLPDFARRATWAHQNSFEVFPIFAAAVLTVVTMDRTSNLAVTLSAIFLVCRMLFSAFYIADLAFPRSFAWVSGMICIAGLFAVALGWLN